MTSDNEYAIGLMSGTSVDGIDAALIRIDNANHSHPRVRLIYANFTPMPDQTRALVLQASVPDASVRLVGELDRELGELFARSANRVIEEAGILRRQVRVIGSHGQTIAHYPSGLRGFTWQVGNPAVIAARTGIDVVSDFRDMDVALGGQGAPLVPYFDWTQLSSSQESRVILNIGGIANITRLVAGGALESVMGYDTGPGNMVLDGAIYRLSDGQLRVDQDGQWASCGQCRDELLAQWLHHPYFVECPPKSSGREQFGSAYISARLQDAYAKGISHEDIMRTLTVLVAQTIADGIWQSVSGPFALIASGGGTKNRVLMEELARRLSLIRPWEHSDLYGIPADSKEAMAFAYLAFQLTRRRGTAIPSATGASRPHLQGSWTPAR